MGKYKHTTDKGECIFCEIAKGNMKPLGEAVIYEDDRYMAWLSPFPNTEGFTVIITKEHYDSDVITLPDNILQGFALMYKKISKMLLDYFPDVGKVGLIMEGTGINHAHIKLFPMHGTESFKKGEWKQIRSTQQGYFEKYEGYICSNDGPQADFVKLQELARKIRGV